VVNNAIVSKILLATDFSDSAVRAQAYTEYLAVALKASVIVLHVSALPPHGVAASKEEMDVRTKLRTLRDSIRQRAVSVAIQRSCGNPGDEILSAARELDADLIVMGLQGHTHVPYGLIGSTAHAVTARGSCPVLTVPLPGKEASPCTLTASGEVKVRRILAPVDFSGPSLDSLECAIHLAHGLGVDLVLVHVLEPLHGDWNHHRMQDAAHMRNEWKERLGDLAGLMKSLGLSATYEVRSGFPPDSIVAGALQYQCDLIVMGTHGQRGREGMNVGSVAEAVLKQSACPVLTVRTPNFVAARRTAIRDVLSQKSGDAANEMR
jgi:nucleotide-binding universal stress UspA family protein